MNASPRTQKTQTKSREILSGVRAIVVGYCETQSDTFIADATQKLFEQAKHIKENNEQRRLFEAIQYLEKNASNLPKHLEKSIKQQFKQIFNQTPSATVRAIQENIDEGELSLVKNSDREIDVAISTLSARIENSCSEELFGIGQRMAMLNKGVKLSEEEAPYGPRFLSRTFFNFISEAEQEQPIQLLLLKLFERSVIAKLGEMYEEMNRYLISTNVLPNLRYNKSNTAETGKPLKRRKTDKLTAESEQRQTELYQVLESILNSAPSAIDPAQPMMSTEQVLHDLLQQQQQPVADLIGQASSATLPNTNTLPLQQALECVTLLFDIINSESSLGAPVKNLFSHLRTPYARMALSDPAFLANPQHDARQLFQAMVHAGEQWTDQETEPTNEVTQRIKGIVEKVINEASDAEQLDPGIFSELLDDFTQFIESFEKKIKLKEQRSVQAAEGREKLKENQLKVDKVIEQKITDDDIPKPIKQLISDVWSSYMTYILLRHGEDNEKWETAVATIDSILWYIEPKTSEEELTKAAQLKDSLYDRLTEGMTNVGLDSADIKTKLNSLELCRKLATENTNATEVKAATNHSKNTASDAQPQPESQAQSHPPSQLEQKQQERRVKNPVETPQQPASGVSNTKESTAASKNRIQQQKSALEQQSRDTEQESPTTVTPSSPPRQASEFDIERVLTMKFGTWLDWHKPGEKPRQIKLTWYNLRTQNCMLSNRAGKEVGMVTANTIALGLVDGWINVIDKPRKKPLFERMLETVTGKSKSTAQLKKSSI